MRDSRYEILASVLSSMLIEVRAECAEDEVLIRPCFEIQVVLTLDRWNPHYVEKILRMSKIRFSRRRFDFYLYNPFPATFGGAKKQGAIMFQVLKRNGYFVRICTPQDWNTN